MKEGIEMPKVNKVVQIDGVEQEVDGRVGISTIEPGLAESFNLKVIDGLTESLEDEMEGLESMAEEYLLHQKEGWLLQEILDEIYPMRADEEFEREDFFAENYCLERIEEMEEMKMMENRSEDAIEMDEKVEAEETAKMEPEDNGVDVVGFEGPEKEADQLGGSIDDSVWPREILADASIQDNKVGVVTSSQNAVISRATPRAKRKSIVYWLAKSRGKTRKLKKPTVVSIKNSGKYSGFTFHGNVISEIGNPDLIQVGITGEGILISKKLSANKKVDGYFAIRRQGSMYNLYSTSLVAEIAKEFELDFSNGSLKFYDVEYLIVNRRKAAHIKLT